MYIVECKHIISYNLIQRSNTTAVTNRES